MRVPDRRLGFPDRDVAGLRQLNGQPHLLHHLQQGVPAGLQEGAAVPIPQQYVEAAKVTGAEK